MQRKRKGVASTEVLRQTRQALEKMLKEKVNKIFGRWNIWMLIFCLVLAYFAINPSFSSHGVSIVYVEKNSSAYNAGIAAPKESDSPRSKEIILSVQNQRINTLEDYNNLMATLLSTYKPGDYINIVTDRNRNGYAVRLPSVAQEAQALNLSNSTINTVNETAGQGFIPGVQDIGIKVKQAPSTNIRRGLDLEGGTRVILEPGKKVSDDEFDMIMSNLKQRLNVYGLSDIIVRSASDLAGNKYIIIEIAGINQEEVRNLIGKQGKFEAKIGNTTVFSGGGDIKTVIRSADRAGIDATRGCGMLSDGSTWSCRFHFGIVLSQGAAERQAQATEKLGVVTVDEQGKQLNREDYYLNSKMDFYLDDKETDSLNIGADLKGRAVTDIQISGSGTGRNEQEARFNALEEMKRMQTILITGSLPVKMNIVKTDSLSPVLGMEFLKNAILIALVSIIAVVVIIAVAYKKMVIIAPIVITMASELILILGFAAAFSWNLDLLSIAGIIIVIGTGVDHQIIITDETLKKTREQLNWIQKIKRAFMIIIIASLTNIGAMLPLMFAGAGLLKGFALTSIVGVLIGILITRPAYSTMIEVLLKD